MTKHRVEMPRYETVGALSQTHAEQMEPLRRQSLEKRLALLAELQRTQIEPVDQPLGQDGVKPPDDQSSGPQQESLLQIEIRDVGNFIVPETPEILAAVEALNQAHTALQEFQKSSEEQLQAEQDKTRDLLLESMGEQGWLLADMFRRDYEETNSYSDLFIFVETGTAAVANGTACEHKRINLDEFDAVEQRMWEEAEQHLTRLTDIPRITEEQISEARRALSARVPPEALMEILVAQEQEGWRFVALLNRSLVFIKYKS